MEQELLSNLCTILSDFQAHWEDEDNYYISDRGTFNLHNICSALCHFYIDHHASLDAIQQQALFDLVEKELCSDSKTSAIIAEEFLQVIAALDAGNSAQTYLGSNSASICVPPVDP
ncbi:MAG: hypothetical protein HRU15_13230 [Planctomycetes bacterium]|nr:hypothetical protein [Planctomycetota bacterium]